MIWLGAIDADKTLKPKIKDLVPWGLENIKYLGLSTANPLATNFNGRDRTKKRQKHNGTEQAGDTYFGEKAFVLNSQYDRADLINSELDSDIYRYSYVINDASCLAIAWCRSARGYAVEKWKENYEKKFEAC